MPIFTGPTVLPQSTFAAERSTYIEIKNDLAAEFNRNDPGTLDLAGQAINEAIRWYNRYTWPWEILTTDITIVSGTQTYALPAAFKKELAAYRLVSNREHYRLIYIPFADYINRYQTDINGTIQAYTFQNQFETGQVTFYPRPNAADNVRVYYYRHTPTMRTDEATIELPAYAEGALRQLARYELLKRLGGTDQMAKMGSARADAMQARSELVALCTNNEDAY